MKIWDAFASFERAGQGLLFSEEFSYCGDLVSEWLRGVVVERRRPVRVDCVAVTEQYAALQAGNRTDLPAGVTNPPFAEFFLDFGRSAALIRQDPNASTLFEAILFGRDSANEPVACGWFRTNADGSHSYLPGVTESNAPEAFVTLNGIGGMVHLAVLLMNCRNIELVEVGEHRTPAALARSKKKNRIPRLDFKTLYIKNFAKTEIGRPKSEKSEPLLPKHIVMGHLRTYHEERPLFGKHVGTFWVPQHARGEVRNGIVVKDYVLEETAQ